MKRNPLLRFTGKIKGKAYEKGMKHYLLQNTWSYLILFAFKVLLDQKCHFQLLGEEILGRTEHLFPQDMSGKNTKTKFTTKRKDRWRKVKDFLLKKRFIFDPLRWTIDLGKIYLIYSKPRNIQEHSLGYGCDFKPNKVQPIANITNETNYFDHYFSGYSQ